MRVSALALTVLLGLASTASADGFDDAVKAATPIHSAESMTALFWSQQASCGKAKTDLLRRQCEGVRDARRNLVASETYVVDVAGPAIQVTSKPESMSVEVTLRACLACDAEGPVIVGKGAHKMKRGTLQAAELTSKTKVFKAVANADHWGTHIASRLRAQFLVRVPPSVKRFKAGGRQGYKLDVVGYRLYDPCKGSVLAAKPTSKRGPVRSAACKDEPALVADKPTKSAPEIQHPDRLSTSQIKTAMTGVMELADKCHEAYGIEGMATFKLVIAGSGKLKTAEQSGDFAGTPTGICLNEAMKRASFPKSKKKETPVTYPLVLQ